MATDPLSRAVSEVLWPFLNGEGFKKSASRKFARERNGVIQQVWVDASGAAKNKSTRIVLCCTFPYAESQGYMDPHGFIINNGKHYDMSTELAAQTAMSQVVTALKQSQLAALDNIASSERMLAALKPFANRNWYAAFTELQQRWLSGDAELLQRAASNRQALKL